jgi:hypothetical protein
MRVRIIGRPHLEQGGLRLSTNLYLGASAIAAESERSYCWDSESISRCETGPVMLPKTVRRLGAGEVAVTLIEVVPGIICIETVPARARLGPFLLRSSFGVPAAD